jgi:5-methylcytosine-specific restriction enzyme subunit McrC
MEHPAEEHDRSTPWYSRAGIPIKNLWTLLVYANGLARFLDRFEGSADDAADLPELLARLLIVVVNRRLRRNLTRAYQPREQVVNRVRGRIDWLKTDSELLLRRGQVACRYEDLTNDTPRNRLVRQALEQSAACVSDAEVASQCRTLARDLSRLGVGPRRPTRPELARDQIARHDSDDRLMVSVAILALDLVLPGETRGNVRTTRLDRDEALLAKIFEKAIAGFYKYELHGRNGWEVSSQPSLRWILASPTPGLAALLPGMRADLILERKSHWDKPSSRLVVDTKFTGILTLNQQGQDRFKSGNIYQLYTYLRSQEGCAPSADRAAGLLLYPALRHAIDEAVTIQGHRLRFATIDLAHEASIWKARLLELAETSQGVETAPTIRTGV